MQEGERWCGQPSGGPWRDARQGSGQRQRTGAVLWDQPPPPWGSSAGSSLKPRDLQPIDNLDNISPFRFAERFFPIESGNPALGFRRTGTHPGTPGILGFLACNGKGSALADPPGSGSLPVCGVGSTIAKRMYAVLARKYCGARVCSVLANRSPGCSVSFMGIGSARITGLRKSALSPKGDTETQAKVPSTPAEKQTPGRSSHGGVCFLLWGEPGRPASGG
jgi:hypothetical protein